VTIAKIIDPVCDMVVDLAEARDAGLTLEYPDREYAFCAAGCQARFAKDPKAYVPKVEAWLAAQLDHGSAAATERTDLPIDAGVRAWYESCRCCLSDAYPQVVEVLDRERAAGHHAPVDAGICDAADARTDTTTSP
jgi:YHS domain-containing protein